MMCVLPHCLLIEMPVHEWTAEEFLRTQKPWVRFSDAGISGQLREGRLSCRELVFVKGSLNASIKHLTRMCESIFLDNVMSIDYSIERNSATAQGNIWVPSLHDLVILLRDILASEKKPAVVFILEREDVLRGFRVKRLEQLVSDLLAQNVTVITNWSVVAHIATLTVPTLTRDC